MSEFVCIGVPYHLGERVPDRALVNLIRDSGLVDEIDATWADFVPDFSRAPDPITAVNRALAQTLGLYRRHIPLIFASDCMASLGAVAGLSAAHGTGLGVVWFDAHGDFNTPETSPSGYVGGMPLAMLAGRGDLRYTQALGLAPLAEADIVLAGGRDLDPAEAEALRSSAVAHVPDVSTMIAAALPDKALYLHLDMDIVRPEDMPGMAFPTPGGPTLDQLAAVVEHVTRSSRVIGVMLSATQSPDALPSLAGPLALARALVRGFRTRA